MRIRAAIHGRDKKPFVFQELGKVAAIGRWRGLPMFWGSILRPDRLDDVARTEPLADSGRGERKLRIMLDWGLDLIFPKDIVEIDIGTERDRRRCNITMKSEPT